MATFGTCADWLATDIETIEECEVAGSYLLCVNDINDATHAVTATCTNQFDMTDASGKRVRNAGMKFTSTLRTCDVSDDAWPQLKEDGRKVADGAPDDALNAHVMERVFSVRRNASGGLVRAG